MVMKEVKESTFTMKCGESDLEKINCMSKFYGLSKSAYIRLLVDNDFKRLKSILNISKNKELNKLKEKFDLLCKSVDK